MTRSPIRVGEVRFEAYGPESLEACQVLFDANCPRFFAPNERADYLRYLLGPPERYTVVRSGDRTVGAYGLEADPSRGRGRLTWILVDPRSQGLGVGSKMMTRAREEAKAAGLAVLDIAASQHSEPFFRRFGARDVLRTPDGWGPGMHCIDMEWPL